MSTVATDVRGVAPGAFWRNPVRRLGVALFEALTIGCAMVTEMSIIDHLEELRRRVLKSLFAVVAGIFVSWGYIVPLIGFLRHPAEIAGIKLVAIEATEIFSVYFKVAFAGGICLAAPIILWQVWQFIAPGLHRHEKRYALPFLLSTTVCFVVGAVFGYGILVPLSLKISTIMGHDVQIEIQLRAAAYFDLLTMLVLCAGATFEIPPIIFILSRIGLINARLLARNFQYAILLACILAAVLTPTPDATTMMLVAIPMISLYAVGILVAWVFGKKRVAE